ncbi:lipase maturation factor family protein [Corallococcus sp. M34]|uniref:lipase maturation factor family protein n=1 Tax=Citreicoccus inhibens TaxID=2849499 RepID=UPI001C236916|nr:lipase maturation factor family protein [Citreicoccus inhibens]
MGGMRAAVRTRPLVLYDGDCGFCLRWVRRWMERTEGRVRFEPSRWWLRALFGISREEARRAMQFIEPQGRRSSGAEAVFRLLTWSPHVGTRWLAALGLLPGVRQAAGGVYARVARHRRGAARWDRWLFGRSTQVPRYRAVRWVFSRMLGGTFLVAFTSLGRQVLGLYGARGIRPIREVVDPPLRASTARHRAWRAPSVFWWGASDAALVRGCRAGQALSVALLFDVAPRLSATLLWGLYLSYVSLGREFLSFQWDVLLLEMGLLAALTAPGGLRPGLGRHEPAAWEVLLFRLLVFRLYLGSGLSKLQSGDRTWRELTACGVYYETAPLPTRGGWYAHHLPRGFQRAATLMVLGLETAVPFLVFGPKQVRRFAFACFTFLQAAISATGNYGFFNLQSWALGLWLLDDSALRRVVPARLWSDAPSPRPRWRAALSALAAVPVGVLSATEVLQRFSWWPPRRPRRVLEWLDRLEASARPLRSLNRYGLFAVMTVSRPEIVVEGSEDGVNWRPYPFRFKVSDVRQAPRQVAPHQPRLDWQMWFAALSRPPSWFLAFLGRLLEGAPEVLGLLAGNPFAGSPPQHVRAWLYDYRMASWEEHRRTGVWWRRVPLGPYVPPLRRVLGDEPEWMPPRLQWSE